MSFDYYIQYPCKVRESASDEELLQMEKSKNRAEYVLNLMRNDPKTDKSIPESEWTFQVMVQRPEGLEEKRVKIVDLLAESVPLKSLSVNCKGCTANIKQVDFGCGGAINYPLTAATEKWLISMLPEDINSQAGKLLQMAINDFNFDGKAIDASRNRKDLYESSVPEIRKWGSFFSKKTSISSSQILHMIMNVGNLQPAHAKLVAYFLGYINDSFECIDKNENRPTNNDDRGVGQFKELFMAMSFAGTKGYSVFVDS
jgi:hypothetical protein